MTALIRLIERHDACSFAGLISVETAQTEFMVSAHESDRADCARERVPAAVAGSDQSTFDGDFRQFGNERFNTHSASPLGLVEGKSAPLSSGYKIDIPVNMNWGAK